ncbi:hypothetical protein Tco_1579316, partial [Tanacetum coccineum]
NKDAKSHKTTKRYMPVEKSSASKKPERQIPTGHRFSNKKTTTVPEKKINPRFVINGLTVTTHGSIVDIPHIHACKQTLGLSAAVQASVINVKWRLLKITLQAPFLNVQMMSDHNSSDLAPQRQEMSIENVSSGLVPQGQKASDYDNSDPVPPRQNVVPTAEKTDSSQQGLEFLFSPLLEEYYNPAHGHAEDNNNDQAPNASIQEAEFINPYHPLEQFHGNPTMPVRTRRQLATNPEMCMFALTVSIVKPKNIKEAMADSAWIEAMQDELHQFDCNSQ